MVKSDLVFVSGICLLVLVIAVILFVVAGASLVAFLMGMEIAYCNNLSALNPDLEYRWLVIGGCMVKTPQGVFVSAHDVRYVNGQVEFTEK